MKFAEELQKAHESQTIVRIYRDKAISSFIVGYVAEIGEKLLSVLVVANGVYFDGFVVIRLEDIRAVKNPGDWSQFSEMALERRNEVRPNHAVDLRTWKTVIESSRKTYPIARYQCFDDERYSEVVWTTGNAREIDDSLVRIRPSIPAVRGANARNCLQWTS